MRHLVDEELWALWRRLVRAMSWLRMPYELFFARSSWSLVGLDFLSGLANTRTTWRAFSVLEALPPARLRQLHALASLNHRRHEAISRWMAIGFVTLPVSAVLTLAQLSPRTLDALAGARGLVSWQLLLAYVAAVVGLYLLWAWRARQLLTVVELWLIQRGLGLQERGEEAEPPLQPPVGT